MLTEKERETLPENRLLKPLRLYWENNEKSRALEDRRKELMIQKQVWYGTKRTLEPSKIRPELEKRWGVWREGEEVKGNVREWKEAVAARPGQTKDAEVVISAGLAEKQTREIEVGEERPSSDEAIFVGGDIAKTSSITTNIELSNDIISKKTAGEESLSASENPGVQAAAEGTLMVVKGDKMAKTEGVIGQEQHNEFIDREEAIKEVFRLKKDLDTENYRLLSEIKKGAEWIAGRYAAKEAVIKAYRSRRLTFHDIWIENNTRRNGMSAAPETRIISVDGSWEDSQIVPMNISHDTEYATAVCLAQDGESEPARELAELHSQIRKLSKVVNRDMVKGADDRTLDRNPRPGDTKVKNNPVRRLSIDKQNSVPTTGVDLPEKPVVRRVHSNIVENGKPGKQHPLETSHWEQVSQEANETRRLSERVLELESKLAHLMGEKFAQETTQKSPNRAR